jgi:DNA helicase II / ATP-dependent DNA helicase PcrA
LVIEKQMKLTDEQRAAVIEPGNVMLVACPGSGKTRAIVAKLLRAVEAVRGTPRRVACITYTNAAVHEIEQRLRTYGSTGDEELCDVSTIHSFCLNNILRHFFWKLPECRNGFVVLPSDSEVFLQTVADVCGAVSLDWITLRVTSSNCSTAGQTEPQSRAACLLPQRRRSGNV